MKRPLNSRALYGSDVRRVFSSKDCLIFDEDGELLSTVDNFNATISFQTATYQSLGSPIQQQHLVGYSVNIEVSNCIVESDKFLQGAADFMTYGQHAPSWNLRSVISGYGDDENSEIFIWRNCVPTGDWNIANYSVGDIIKRTLHFAGNCAPELQRALIYAE